jgi:glycosyltransferase involved in cell wall biosynthesis
VWALRDDQAALRGDQAALHAQAALRLDEIQRHLDAWTAYARLDLEGVTTDRRVSVILPTRNRAALLPRAVRSVLNQSYVSWELVVVDDGSEDETPTLMAAMSDPRVRTVRQRYRGTSAARNAGLAVASGDYVTYLDDDNVMHPGWLRAVVWAFEHDPEADVAIGSRIVDDWPRLAGPDSRPGPKLLLPFFDRDLLARGNCADIGTVAHRHGLAEAYFDEELSTVEDWDFIFRLTRDRDPCLVPAIACLYTTTGPNRMSDLGSKQHHINRVLEKIRDQH